VTDLTHNGQRAVHIEEERRARATPPARSLLLLLTSRHGGCEMVRSLLQNDPQWTVVGDLDNADMAMPVARRTAPDFIVIAMDLADGALVDVIEALRQQSTTSRVVLFSETTEGLRQQEFVQQGVIIRMLWRNVHEKTLAAALDLSEWGLRVESEEIQTETAAEVGRPREAAKEYKFNERQRQVAALLRTERTQPEIGKALRLSTRRVEDIVRELKEITGARSIGELVDKLRDVDLGDPFQDE